MLINSPLSLALSAAKITASAHDGPRSPKPATLGRGVHSDARRRGNRGNRSKRGARRHHAKRRAAIVKLARR